MKFCPNVVTLTIYTEDNTANKCIELKEAHMSDWTKQTEELMKTWGKAQQQFWDAWKAAMPKVGTAQATQTWGTMVTFWRQAIEQTARAQVEWANMWAESIRAQESAPKELKDWTDQIVSTTKTWTESQAQLWESILDTMNQSTPEQLIQHMDEGAHLAFQTWRDAVHKAVGAQKELTRYWTSGTGGKKP
jgi:hypothetical protein